MAKVFCMVPVLDSHLMYIAEHMRSEDVQEVLASDGVSPLRVLRDSVRTSVMAFTALDDDMTPVFVWGVSAADANYPEWHCLWFLGTVHELEPERWRKFLRTCRHYLPMVEKRYPKLFNWIDARYNKSVRWAQWLGGKVQPARPHGAAGMPFYLVTRER